jgi:alditol oxidase
LRRNVRYTAGSDFADELLNFFISDILFSEWIASLPYMAWAPDDTRKNWAGNIVYGAANFDSAGSLAEVRAFVRSREKVKVLGTRHCFNTIADSTEQFLSLDEMSSVVALDVERRTVTVAGRMTYGQLCPSLEERGFALHNLASLPHISIAGACSTATHGSGVKNGNLATAVVGIELVTAAGDVVELSRETNGDVFLGCVVGLGALGVITKMTLEVQPRFEMRQWVYENLPLSELIAHFDEIEAAAYSVSLFTDWRGRRINEVWLKCAGEFDAPEEFFGAKRATKNLHPIAEISAENCTEQMGMAGPWHERLPHFRMGFMPSAGEELQTEYFVPRRHAVEAVLALERLGERISPHLFISEIRAVGADELWLSPCYRQESVALHFTWKPDWPAVRGVLPEIERELAPFGARPHWGKLFTMAGVELRARYARIPDFVRLCREYDPQAKFRNAFLETVLQV